MSEDCKIEEATVEEWTASLNSITGVSLLTMFTVSVQMSFTLAPLADATLRFGDAVDGDGDECDICCISDNRKRLKLWPNGSLGALPINLKDE
jgi:hypothetical protein